METVYQLMQEAVERKATRVIVQPDLEGEYHVRFRIDGAEENISSLGALQGGSLVSAFKHAAGMSTSERRSSQSGGFFLQTGKAPLNCPAQSSRSGGGEQIVVRLGTIEAVPPLEGLGIPAGGLAELRELLGGGSGLVLLLGRPAAASRRRCIQSCSRRSWRSAGSPLLKARSNSSSTMSCRTKSIRIAAIRC